MRLVILSGHPKGLKFNPPNLQVSVIGSQNQSLVQFLKSAAEIVYVLIVFSHPHDFLHLSVSLGPVVKYFCDRDNGDNCRRYCEEKRQYLHDIASFVLVCTVHVHLTRKPGLQVRGGALRDLCSGETCTGRRQNTLTAETEPGPRARIASEEPADRI